MADPCVTLVALNCLGLVYLYQAVSPYNHACMRDLVLHHYMKWEYRSHIDWDPSTMSAKAEGVTVIAPVLLSHFPTPTVVQSARSRQS